MIHLPSLYITSTTSVVPQQLHTRLATQSCPLPWTQQLHPSGFVCTMLYITSGLTTTFPEFTMLFVEDTVRQDSREREQSHRCSSQQKADRVPATLQ